MIERQLDVPFAWHPNGGDCAPIDVSLKFS